MYCTSKYRWSTARCKTRHVLPSLLLWGLTHVQGQWWNFPPSYASKQECAQFDSSYSCNISSHQTAESCSSESKKLCSIAQKEKNDRTGPASPLLIPPPFFSSLFITGIPNGYECFSACFSQSCVLTIASHCKWRLQGRGRPSFLCRGHTSKSISPEMQFTE